jgi:hypothetical protein
MIAIQRRHEMGQSLWLDNAIRSLLVSGMLGHRSFTRLRYFQKHSSRSMGRTE